MAYYESFGNRRKGKHGGDLFKLDTKNKTSEENLKDIIQGLYVKKPFQNETSPTNKTLSFESKFGLRGTQKNASDSRKLSYLNALVTLLVQAKEDRDCLGFTPDELMTCIRINLVEESMVIRAAALRVLRYLIKTESDVATFNNLKLPYLIIRSMDLMLRNEEERAQALRVVRRVVAVVGAAGQIRRHRAAFVDPGLLRCLTAVARAGIPGDGTGDRLSKPAIATLAEICVLNPDMFISCGGVNAVTRQLAECATPRMAEALCGVLLHALNDPASRRSARIDLMCLSSPYCDFHFRPAGTESSRDEREMRFTCSRLALLCVLRSWPGLLHFCHPYSASGLRALVAALYLPRLEVRKAILDLLYELVGLPQPEWTDEISVALGAIDPSDFQDSWRLNEGFIAEEGIAILPHLGATGPDITEIHLALLLQCFLEAGLLDGLAEVIVTSDTFISVRATVLLGQLLHLVHQFLPPQICSITPALPSLMSQASEGKPQALAAVAALRRLHSMLEARPASSSLFLDHIIQYCSGAFKEKEDSTKIKKEKDNASMAKTKDIHKDSFEFLNESDHENEPKRHNSVGSRDFSMRNVSALPKSKSLSSAASKLLNWFERDSDSLLRSTLVMANKDGNTWNWEIIRTILKENDNAPLLNLKDHNHKAWAARIVSYLKPSSNKYSHTDLSSTCHGHSATRAGCQLIRHLLRHNDLDSQRLLEDLFSDVSRQIEAIETGLKAHECLFSPQHMCNTMCQMYFLFIGQLCHSQAGLKLFKQTRLYENLMELSTKTHHSCYVKLVISSLDYTIDSFPREILAKTLTCNIQASRLYTTQFLNVLLRATRKSRELVRRKSKMKKNFEYAKTPKEESESGVDMETWTLQMLVGQIKDECKEVVKAALSILEEAFTVPIFVEKMMTLKNTLCQNCRLDRNAEPSTLELSAVGDRGYLLWLTLEVASAAQSTDAKSMAFVKKHLDFWTKSYNYRYVRLVDASVHEALTLGEGGGRGAPRWRRTARPPPHIHGTLARSSQARARALMAGTLPHHYKVLQRKKFSTDQDIGDLKASLWAVGNTAVTPQGLQLLMNLSNGFLEDSVLVHIVRLTKYCPVYAVRATAFYVLGLIGSTYDGANFLSELGWLCVRHTRHEQFPLIPDETYSLYDNNLHCYVTSPERFHTYDATSEHSDHTDQSIAESLPSDNTKISKTALAEPSIEQDVVDAKFSLDQTKKENDKRKSQTLPPQGCSNDRPLLSESRTVDTLRDCSGYERHHRPLENRMLIGRMNSLDHAHEGRVRNTSESSTSGVSSCDSFLGKYAIPLITMKFNKSIVEEDVKKSAMRSTPRFVIQSKIAVSAIIRDVEETEDRVLTLSPIPSSSSLYGMKSSNSTQRPRISELQRRTSTSSFAGHESGSSPPSQMDMTGYATLKSLNRRPHLSESAATGSSDAADLSWLLTDTNRRQKAFSSLRDRTKSTRERRNKMSLLEYDWKPLSFSETLRQSSNSMRRADTAAAPRTPRPAPCPAYLGVCLPRDLMDLFPSDDRKDDDADKCETTKRGRLPSFLADTSIASFDKSRATPDSQKMSYRGSHHTTSTSVVVRGTFAVSSTPTATPNPKAKHSSKTDVSLESINTTKDNINESHEKIDDAEDGGNKEARNDDDKPMEEKILSAIAESENSGKRKVWRHVAADCLACTRTRPPSSHELREAFFAGITSLDEHDSALNSPLPEKGSPQAQLLHQVHFMSNPIHLRQTRSVLLSLKQRHPDVFRSPCVYSDVCALLSRDTYMLCARRFLQEMFLDTSFECFTAETAAILTRHGVVLTSPTTAILEGQP